MLTLYKLYVIIYIMKETEVIKMANFYKIQCYNPLNEVDSEKVNALAEDIKNNGWKGMPILFIEGQLITGSHRFAALHKIEKEDEYGDYIDLLSNENIALDVSEEINDYCEKNDCSYNQIDYSCLSYVFKGTDIEKYADQIEEW